MPTIIIINIIKSTYSIKTMKYLNHHSVKLLLVDSDQPMFGCESFLQILEIDVDLFLPFVAFFSLLIIDYLFEDQKFKNYLIFLILILSFPLPIIYQKYMDPLFYIFLFGLINSTYIKNLIFDKSVRPAFLFMYFGSFFLFSYYFYL